MALLKNFSVRATEARYYNFDRSRRQNNGGAPRIAQPRKGGTIQPAGSQFRAARPTRRRTARHDAGRRAWRGGGGTGGVPDSEANRRRGKHAPAEAQTGCDYRTSKRTDPDKSDSIPFHWARAGNLRNMLL